MKTLYLLLILVIFGCSSNRPGSVTSQNPNKDSIVNFGSADSLSPPDSIFQSCFDPELFYVQIGDTISLQDHQLSKTGHGKKLRQVNNIEKKKLLQQFETAFSGKDLFYYKALSCDGLQSSLTLLTPGDDGMLLLWLKYNATRKLIGFDTLLFNYGDGQIGEEEYAVRSKDDEFTLWWIREETMRDDVDSMTSLIDTIVYNRKIVSNGDFETLSKTPLSSTHYMVEWANDNPKRLKKHSLYDLIPKNKSLHKVFKGHIRYEMSEDFLVLINGKNNKKDLMIVFSTSRDFQKMLYIPEFSRDKFYDISLFKSLINITSYQSKTGKRDEIFTIILLMNLFTYHRRVFRQQGKF